MGSFSLVTLNHAFSRLVTRLALGNEASGLEYQLISNGQVSTAAKRGMISF